MICGSCFSTSSCSSTSRPSSRRATTSSARGLRDAIDNSLSIGGCLGRDAEVVEQGLHVAAEGFVVAVDGGPVLGWAALSGCSDPGDEGGDDFVAEGEQRGDGARGDLGNVVAAGAAGFEDELFAAEFA